MEANMLKKLIYDCEFSDKEDILIEIIQKCDINNYNALQELTNNDFVKKCVDYMKIPVSPGVQLMLNIIGKKVKNLSKTQFNDMYANDNHKYEKIEEYPLLNILEKQTQNRTYTSTLKDFSTLIRLKAGREVHVLLSENLPIPKTSATDKYLSNFDYICEGELQVRNVFELKEIC